MDPNTGHLVEILNSAAPDGRNLQELLEDGYEEVPPELVQEAKALLGKQVEGHVDLQAVSRLSQFAADSRRRKAKKKARNRRLRKQRRHRK